MKKLFIGLSVVAISITVFAFTSLKKDYKKPLLNSWYEYRGPVPSSLSDLKDENNYFLVTAPAGCSSDQNICAVSVPGSDEHPDAFTTIIESDIVNAFQNNQPVTGYIEMKE